MYRENISQYSKGYIWQAHSYYHTQQGKAENFSSKSGTRQAYPPLSLLFSVVLEVLPEKLGKKKKKKKNKKAYKSKGK